MCLRILKFTKEPTLQAIKSAACVVNTEMRNLKAVHAPSGTKHNILVKKLKLFIFYFISECFPVFPIAFCLALCMSDT